MIDVTDGFTSIEVAPDGFPYFNVNGYVSTTLAERSAQHRNSTGARVTVEFFRHSPLPPNAGIRVHYDIAGNGGLREILGVPQLTHTTARQGDRAVYHYRLSHWIPALAVMRFAEA